MSLTLRNVKGSPLTYTEMDNNLTYLEGLTSSTGSTATFGSVSANTVTITTQPANDTSTGGTVNTLTISGNGTINKKPISNARVYRALVTQTGTAAPVATVLENTLGGTPTWARTGVGNYTITLTGKFTVGKTIVNGQTEFTGNGVKIETITDLAGWVGYVNYDTFAAPNVINMSIYNTGFVGFVEWSLALGNTPYYIEIISY
jgi:hypothetical protein